MMNRALLAIAFHLPLSGVGGISAPAWAESAVVVRVLDGDSLRVILAGQEVVVRVSGIDSPETARAKCERERQLGLLAKAKAMELLPVGTRLELIRVATRDRYGRVLAHITLPSGEDFGRLMLQRGLAVAYHGRGARQDWCR